MGDKSPKAKQRDEKQKKEQGQKDSARPRPSRRRVRRRPPRGRSSRFLRRRSRRSIWRAPSAAGGSHRKPGRTRGPRSLAGQARRVRDSVRSHRGVPFVRPSGMSPVGHRRTRASGTLGRWSSGRPPSTTRSTCPRGSAAHTSTARCSIPRAAAPVDGRGCPLGAGVPRDGRADSDAIGLCARADYDGAGLRRCDRTSATTRGRSSTTPSWRSASSSASSRGAEVDVRRDGGRRREREASLLSLRARTALCAALRRRLRPKQGGGESPHLHDLPQRGVLGWRDRVPRSRRRYSGRGPGWRSCFNIGSCTRARRSPPA